MSITASIEAFETGASLFKRTYEASEIHERNTFEAR